MVRVAEFDHSSSYCLGVDGQRENGKKRSKMAIVFFSLAIRRHERLGEGGGEFCVANNIDSLSIHLFPFYFSEKSKRANKYNLTIDFSWSSSISSLYEKRVCLERERERDTFGLTLLNNSRILTCRNAAECGVGTVNAIAVKRAVIDRRRRRRRRLHMNSVY